MFEITHLTPKNNYNQNDEKKTTQPHTQKQKHIHTDYGKILNLTKKVNTLLLISR